MDRACNWRTKPVVFMMILVMSNAKFSVHLAINRNDPSRSVELVLSSGDSGLLSMLFVWSHKGFAQLTSC